MMRSSSCRLSWQARQPLSAAGNCSREGFFLARPFPSVTVAGMGRMFSQTFYRCPEYILTLILTMMGYYFGFRKCAKAADGRIFDACLKKGDPLFLPAGYIRFFLIGGFVVTGVTLYQRGLLNELRYVEFFAVLSGLIGGYLLAKFTRGIQHTGAFVFFNHMKGAAVLVAAAGLAFLLLSGDGGPENSLSLLMAAVISFYFGSRS